MRTIKFRAWDGQEMFEYLEFKREGEHVVPWTPHRSPKAIMQFTGLHDKNGKEIYEGDIVGGKGQKTYEVEWTVPSFQTVNVRDRYDWQTGIPSWLEVIGNIYENPELLETK